MTFIKKVNRACINFTLLESLCPECVLELFVIFRHLPMIAALLHGRIHLNLHEIRQQTHLTFFSDVLAVLELLQPLVFHSGHQRALQDCLLSFIKVLQV